MKHTKKGKRARLLCAVLAALLLLAVPAVGCTGTGGGDASGTETGDTDTGGGTPTGTATESITVTETQTETATEDTRIEMDIYGNGYNTNMLVGFDEQGHLVDAVSAPRENKQVGMFSSSGSVSTVRRRSTTSARSARSMGTRSPFTRTFRASVPPTISTGGASRCTVTTIVGIAGLSGGIWSC